MIPGQNVYRRKIDDGRTEVDAVVNAELDESDAEMAGSGSVQAISQIRMTWPVRGEIVMDYSMDANMDRHFRSTNAILRF